MKKRKTLIIIVSFIILSVICVGLYSYDKYARLKEQENLLKLETGIFIFESTMDLIDSNKYMLDFLSDIRNEQSIEYCENALKSLVSSKKKMEKVVCTPNFIDEELAKLQENYERTLEIIQKKSDMSAEENDELTNLFIEATPIHVNMIKYMQCFVNLYCIRQFDELPDEQAQNMLKESWWRFGFDETIECPETINEKELYIIWAEQFSGAEVNQSIINKIDTLRLNDNLTSKEYNCKWVELVREICSTDDWDV